MRNQHERYKNNKEGFTTEAMNFLESTFHSTEEKTVIAKFMYDELQRMKDPDEFHFRTALNYYRNGAMQTMMDIKATIETHIRLIKNEADYDGSEAAIDTAWEIIQAVQRITGFDYESDEDLMEYALKATEQESWEYWLENIIPKLKKQ